MASSNSSAIPGGSNSSSNVNLEEERAKLAASMPSRNPMPLSASQEAQVRDIYYARVRARCAEEIKAFADCALGRTFSVAFYCKEPQRVMNNCMKMHATQEEQDAAREEWFAKRIERQKERERKARRKAEQEAFLREWWGLPEKDREEARRRERDTHHMDMVIFLRAHKPVDFFSPKIPNFVLSVVEWSRRGAGGGPEASTLRCTREQRQAGNDQTDETGNQLRCFRAELQ